MGVQLSFGFGNFRLILRAPEGHTTGGGTDEGQIAEIILQNDRGVVLGHRVFRDTRDLLEHLCPAAALDRPKPPGGTPADLREQVARGLGTADNAVVDAAIRGYRGCFTSMDEYVEANLAERLPPDMQWLLACCDPDRLRAGYEAGKVNIWALPLPDGRVFVFETNRALPLPTQALRVALQRGAARAAAVDFLIHAGLAEDHDATRTGDIVTARADAYFAVEALPPTTSRDDAVTMWGRSYLVALRGLQGHAT